jgi:hypothetical protein
MLQVNMSNIYSNAYGDLIYVPLQEYDGVINFATDAWSSPNHYAYVAVTAHLENQGHPIVIVLDVVEVPKVHAFCDALMRSF